MTKGNNKQVYILSLEASDIFSHMHRGTNIKHDYCGMIPFSLELLKLRKEGLIVKYIKSRDKEVSNDIINVKFSQKVKSGNELKKIIDKNKDKSDNKNYINKLEQFSNIIDENIDSKEWQEKSISQLRKSLYADGFKIKFINKKTNDYKEIEYVVYKRSSSKSRTGQCLFIKKSLYNKMIKWSRLNLPLRKNMDIDLASLLAYESLVGSSLEDIIEIEPNNILMISDRESSFFQTCNVVRKGENGHLDSFKEKSKVINSLFDGESLLESSYFEDGVAMKLLRNHMFKSAAFNCNIQKFLINNCPNNISYDKWKLKDMFGNEILAKNVHMITTPSSLKALKFSSVIGEDKDMWEYWKEKVSEDGNLFGVCKHDKQSKFGFDTNLNPLQQTSYQMINCLPIKKEDMKQLTEVEKMYIEKLKNDDDFLIDKINESSSLINSNEMLASLYNLNKEIINTEIFRNFKKSFIRNHINYTKKGKIKLHGDYCVMLGNPLEFLQHAIGCFKDKSVSLKDNEVYTKLFSFGKELVGFRNPNTSPSNVLVVTNRQIEAIEEYFNLTENIVCVNAINFPIQDILSGCDYDSDTLLLFDNNKMLELGKECFGKYDVCINKVESQKKKYKLNSNDMYEIDNQLSTSQRDIGKVVNLGQFCMSVYWDLMNNGEYGEHVNELLRKVDVMTVLSGIAIDMAKKFYELDINKEIRNVSKNKELSKRKKKPLFWKYVSQSKTINKRIELYDCPMDFLIKEIDSIEKAEYRRNVDFEEFLIEQEISKANRRQINTINKIIQKMQSEIIKVNTENLNNKTEKDSLMEDILRNHINQICKLKIKKETVYSILIKISKPSKQINNNFNLRLMNALFNSHKELFLSVFKPKNSHLENPTINKTLDT